MPKNVRVTELRPTAVVRALVITLAVIAVPSPLVSQHRLTPADRVYSDAQGDRGQALYTAQCGTCHGEALDGGQGPSLAGVAFLRMWDGRSVAELVDKVHRTMPATTPGTLTRAQAREVVAYLLKMNGFPAGARELEDEAALAQIGFALLPGSINPAERPLGNLAQVMRGILFSSSNLIFNVQSFDPATKSSGWTPTTPAFSWVDWGAGLYSGWELVDYAAIALAESAPLMLTPGRRCENGKPVPTDRPDWLKFTRELADAGAAVYKASQSRNREAVIEVTNQLADSCLHCHEVYRDKPGGTAADPSNKSARCLP